MPSLKEVKNRITSVQATQQITRAMKLVSAAKLRKAQQQANSSKTTLEWLQRTAQAIYVPLQEADEAPDWCRPRAVTQEILIPITSDKGLCGAFNSTVAKETIQYHHAHVDRAFQLLALGKKGRDLLHSQQITPFADAGDFYQDCTYPAVVALTDQLIQAFVQGDCQQITLIYTRPLTSSTSEVITTPLLPIPTTALTASTPSPWYLYEPAPLALFDKIVPIWFAMQLYTALLESTAAEHQARMVAMETATENATDLLKDLRLHYNRTRQAVITQEILEIIGGASVSG